MADQPRTPPLRVAWALLAIALFAAPGSANGQDVRFRAGAATSNVTPPLGHSINGNMRDGKAQQIHDELHARCLVLDDGTTRLAFAVVDSCAVPREIVHEAKALIRERTGIEPDHVLISATHTHSAPTATGVFQSEPTEGYSRFLATRIADGVQRAANNLAPAEIGWGTGAVPGQVFNRRWFLREGTIPPNPFGETDEKVKMNPSPGSADLVRPAGPTDPTVSVLMVRSPEGRPIALLANYSLHYVGGVGPGHVSADYYGAFADQVQELLDADRLDPPFVALMSNGTSGDINNINFREPRRAGAPYEQIRKVADEVAREAVRVAGAMEFRSDLTLDAATTELTLGVRKPDETELTRAREILDAAEGRELTTLEQLYARETVLIHDYPDSVPVTVQALRVGEVGIVAIPCEVFVEIGLGIRKKSPLQPMFTIELANGYNGYLPDPRGHELGGYETWRARSSYLEVEASNKISDAALSLLRQVEQSRTH